MCFEICSFICISLKTKSCRNKWNALITQLGRPILLKLCSKYIIFSLYRRMRTRRALSLRSSMMFRWEPEGRSLRSSMMFHWEPEGCYRSAPQWCSIENQKGAIAPLLNDVPLRTRRALSLRSSIMFHWEPEGRYRSAPQSCSIENQKGAIAPLLNNNCSCDDISGNKWLEWGSGNDFFLFCFGVGYIRINNF